MEGSGTRRVEACPGEEYCSYVTTDMGDYDYDNYGLDIERGKGCLNKMFLWMENFQKCFTFSPSMEEGTWRDPASLQM